VFRKAWDRSTTVDVAVNGFKEAGLFPFNPDVVLRSVKLDPSNIYTSAEDTVTEMGAAQPPASPDAGTSDLPHISANAVQPSVSSDRGNADIPHSSDEMIQGAPCEPRESTTESRSNVNPASQSPMSKILVIPKVQETNNNKVKHTPPPKAVTGQSFVTL